MQDFTLRKIAIYMAVIILITISMKSAFADNPSLITKPIDDSSLITMHSTAQPTGTMITDEGSAPGDLDLGTVIISLKLYPNPSISSDQFNADLQDPSSPYYHQWLTPQEYGVMFGISTQDIQTITTWLENYGLNVTSVALGRSSMNVTGTVAQVEAAFHAPLDYFSSSQSQQQFIAFTSDIAVPSALAETINSPLFGPPPTPGNALLVPATKIPTPIKHLASTMTTPTNTLVHSQVYTQETSTVSSSLIHTPTTSISIPMRFLRAIENFFKSLFNLQA